MKKSTKRLVLSALLTAMVLPLTAHAADDDLQKRIDKLTKEVADLKSSVKKVEDKSVGKWLTIGGEYRFRVDSLHGTTVPFSDAIATMGNMTNAMINGYSYLNPQTNTLVNVPAVANTQVGAGTPPISNPSLGAYLFMQKTGSLFTPDQFKTILTQYMPSAMINVINSGQINAMMGNLITQTGSVQNAINATALTSQQQKILTFLTNTQNPNSMLMKYIFPQLDGATQAALMGMMTSAPDQFQLYSNLLMQGFLGDPSKYPSSFLKKVPAYKPKNETLYTNKFGIDLTAKATQDITVHAKLDMYKAFGSQSDSTTMGGYFADRVGVFDGTLSHVPSDSLLNVDRAFATWSNILDQPLWFSVGRRPSTNGAPTNLKLNNERPGNGGTPALLVDYAFDGLTVGYAPDLDMLPGAYAKVCYGRGFDSGIKTPSNSIKDTDMLGIAVIPVDTDPLRVWLQWNRGFNIFDFPAMNNTIFGNTAPATSLGSIDWYGMGAMSTLKKVGPGNLNFFTDFGLSVAHPGGNVSQNAGFQGLMSGEFFAPDANRADRTGWAVFAGVRYDLPSKTKLGFEFNHGSKNWITFAPAADDMWTSKVGTRGNVFEPYVIQELDLKPISSYLSKAFFRLGYQYYDFEYTGSNNWVGAPKKISQVQSTDLMLLAPLKEAHDVYATFEVKF